MSGLISSAGSKSGVIGQTEIDYEEGTWDPVPRGASGSSGSWNYSFTGKYTKIGNTVTVTCYGYILNLGSWSGNAELRGLPFSVGLQASNASIVDAAMRTCTTAHNDSHCTFRKGSKLDAIEQWTDWVTGYYLTLTVTYFVA